MNIELPETISSYVTKAAHELRMSREEVIARAILLYLKDRQGYKELQEEMESWERIGEEDASNFFEKHAL
jgi:metal-responsive CopG/Arc/MetJ family transcriptional regulator